MYAYCNIVYLRLLPWYIVNEGVRAALPAHLYLKLRYWALSII